MKNIFYSLFLFTICSFSQGSIVKIDKKVTNAELNDYKIYDKIRAKEKQLDKDITASGFKSIIPSISCYNIDDCYKRLDRIKERKQLINSINYYAKATEIDNLYMELSKKNNRRTSEQAYYYALNRWDESEQILLKKLSDMGKKTNDDINEKRDKQRSAKENKLLDDELAEINASSSELYKDINDSKSLDDFLSDSNLNSNNNNNNNSNNDS